MSSEYNPADYMQFVTRPSMDIALAIIRETEGKS